MCTRTPGTNILSGKKCRVLWQLRNVQPDETVFSGRSGCPLEVGSVPVRVAPAASVSIAAAAAATATAAHCNADATAATATVVTTSAAVAAASMMATSAAARVASSTMPATSTSVATVATMANEFYHRGGSVPFFVKDVEGRQANVRDFFLMKSDLIAIATS